MEQATYFLGANTPEGFVSHYDTLFRDSRIQDLMILKGGPGCGKSTLMRQVGEAAAAQGCQAEYILCSSDPDSLDGLIVPQAGLALVDGTAPHVVEPPLCGLGARYLDLGRFYDADVLSQNSEALKHAKAQNAACYPLCYLALQSAKAAAEAARQIAAAALPDRLWAQAAEQLLPRLPHGEAAAPVLTRFVSAISPKGLLTLPFVVKKVYVIKDNYGLSSSLLESIGNAYATAGYRTALAFDPLMPLRLQAVLVPACKVGYAASSGLFPRVSEDAPCLDLDDAVEKRLCYPDGQRLHALIDMRNAAVDEALAHLKNAKRFHDALEQAYRPAVDFAGVQKETDRVIEVLRQRLHHKI